MRRGGTLSGVCLALAAVVFLVYGRVVHHRFINFDDDDYVSGNARVLSGVSWEGVGWAFASTTQGNWHPLTWLSHMVDAELHGPWPGGHHATNVVLHALNAVLLFWALRGLTGRLWSPALVAALFALHPLHVESVAWVSERKDVLSGTFFMLSLLAYASYVRRRGALSYSFVSLTLAAGLMAKPMLVTLPVLLLLLDIWPLSRRETATRLAAEKIPLFVLAAASSVLTFMVQQRGGATRSLEAVPFAARIVNAALSYLLYLGKTLVPVHLAIFYPHPAVEGSGLSATWMAVGLLAAALLVVITWLSLRQRMRPYLAVGWLWYLITLVPVIGLVQVGEQAMADRYTYLPLVGVFIMAVWAGAEWMEERPHRKRGTAVVVAAGLGVLALVAWKQVGYWKDDVTVYRHALAVSRESPLVHNNLGLALVEQGKLGEGIEEYQAALRLRPGYSWAHNNLGVAFRKQGRLDDAQAHYEEALRSRPDYPEALSNLAGVLAERGQASRARLEYEKALRIRPGDPGILTGLGTLLARQGDLAGGRERLAQAVQAAPWQIEARKNLGIVLMKEGNLPGAIAQYEAAVALRPEDADLRVDLGALLASAGRTVDAEAQLRAALSLSPGHAVARAQLADLLKRQGR